MAQFDTSIYQNLLSGVRSPESFQAERQQLQASELTNALSRQKVDAYSRDQGRQTNLLSLLKGGASADDLAGQGYFDEASKRQAFDANKVDESRKAEKFQIERARSMTERIGQLLGSAKDPQSYAVARQAAAAEGIDVSKVPEQFDPVAIEQLRQQNLTSAQQIEQIWKQKGYDLDLRQQDEVERNNKASEGIQERNNIRSNARMAANGGSGVGGAAPAGGAPAKPAKPLPVGALKMQQEALDSIGISGGIKADLGAVLQQIESGALKLGPVKNAVGAARNTLGISNESSQNLATFKATLEKLRNDSLRLNKGVQTDGDAQRAWNELLQNINDPAVVTKRLKEISALNDRAVELHGGNLEVIRGNYGAAPIDTTSRRNQKPAIQGGLTAEEQSELEELRNRFKGR